jgi:hypothetical protein
MHPDHLKHFRFTGPRRVDKAINTLSGIIEGISIDREINSKEIGFLETWLEDFRDVSSSHPFNELVPVILEALKDGFVTEEEQRDILWLCERVRSGELSDRTCADLQKLHAMLGGIASDGKISEAELRGLSDWLSENEHLATIWPYDEASTLVASVLADGKIDASEHAMLLNFFLEFTAILDDRTIRRPVYAEGERLVGLCAVQPQIHFDQQTFCLTGASHRYTRDEFKNVICNRGGRVVAAMSSKVNYLIVGSEGNPCWMYACYGRKVEQAVEFRKSGARLLIVHENDFYDAIEDAW